MVWPLNMIMLTSKHAGLFPGDIFLKLDAFRKVLETMKGHITKNWFIL